MIEWMLTGEVDMMGWMPFLASKQFVSAFKSSRTCPTQQISKPIFLQDTTVSYGCDGEAREKMIIVFLRFALYVCSMRFRPPASLSLIRPSLFI